jgi:hypothetical protein
MLNLTSFPPRSTEPLCSAGNRCEMLYSLTSVRVILSDQLSEGARVFSVSSILWDASPGQKFEVSSRSPHVPQPLPATPLVSLHRNRLQSDELKGSAPVIEIPAPQAPMASNPA